MQYPIILLLLPTGSVSFMANVMVVSALPHSGVIGQGDHYSTPLRGFLDHHHRTDSSISMHYAAAAAGICVILLVALVGAAAAAPGRGRLFPGPAGIIKNNPDNLHHLQVIFGLMAVRRTHLEINARARRTTDSWRYVFDTYFGPTGDGRAFVMWGDRATGLTKFRTSVMAAMKYHADAYDAGDIGTSSTFLVVVRLQAHDLMAERQVAITAAGDAAAATEAHRGQLNDINRGMGLIPNVQGVAAPPNVVALTREQQEALNMLSTRTRSLNNGANRKFLSYFICVLFDITHY